MKKTIMMTKSMGSALALATVLASGMAHGGGPNARDVMAKSNAVSSLEHVTLSSTLTIGASDGDARSKSFTLFRKVAGDGVHFRTLARFSAPAEIRGEAVLMDERGNGRNEVLLWLPRYKKTRRVETQAQRASFMGSSFSYADMTTQSVDDYKHDIAKNEPCPNDKGSSCFVVVSQPVSDAVRENHGYAKKTTWVRTSDFQAMQTELYDEGGALWKRIVFSDIREVDAAKKKAMPHAIRVEDLKSKKFSQIVVHKADAAASVTDALFTEQSLSREL
jgi:hypothetical protein